MRTLDQLHGIPKVNMLNGFTPLEHMPNLSKYLGINNIYIKRDDEGGYGGGGNKIRKFEYLFFDIISGGYDTVILPAHSQSNAARELVATASRYGIDTIIVTKNVIGRETKSFIDHGNRVLLNILGASLIEAPDNINLDDFINDLSESLVNKGKTPYVMPFGGTNTLGALGYVSCAVELLSQSEGYFGAPPDIVVVPTGSCGTHAGLAAGVALSNASSKVIGFSVLKEQHEATMAVEGLMNSIFNRFYSDKQNATAFVDDCELGDGYGHVTPSCIEAIQLTARLEGIFLDPVYSGKAMAGMISYARRGLIKPDDYVVFIHTGGSQLIHAYADVFNQA